MMRHYILLFLSFLSLPTFAQVVGEPIGTWRTHASYNSLEFVRVGEDKVLAGSQDGMFILYLEDLSMEPFNKIDGLSDIKPTALDYSEFYDIFIIGYESGNIDLVKGNTITNINNVANSNIVGSKSINDINIAGSLAYISTDFGIVVLNFVKEEIKETYLSIGENGTQVQVLETSINTSNDTIIALTNDGIYGANTGVQYNLLDFNNWYKFSVVDQLPENEYIGVAFSSDTTFLATDSALFYLKGSDWLLYENHLVGQTINSVGDENEQLVVQVNDTIFAVHDKSSATGFVNDNYSRANDLVLTPNNELFVASSWGLMSNVSNNQVSFYIPSGSNWEGAFRLYYGDNQVVKFHGGYGSAFVNSSSDRGYEYFDGTKWNLRNNWTTDRGFPSGWQDIVDGVYSPRENKFFFCSYGYGIITYEPSLDTFKYYNDTIPYILEDNFVPLVEYIASSGQYRTIDVGIDKNDVVWFLVFQNSASSPSILAKKTDNTWVQKSFSTTKGAKVVELTIDENNNKWIVLSGSNGAMVYNENDINTTADDQVKYFNTTNGLPTNVVYALEEDKDGEIWVGTSEGIAVFYSLSNLFNNNIQATTPIFDGRPLLTDEIIRAIKVDGGNRKWIGTENGVWLMNEEADEVIHYFNTDNSPLPSNTILDIEIDDKSGEVYIATEQGLVSYIGTAIETGDVHRGNYDIFPNPVKPDFEGYITVDGLAYDATVKFTDVSGGLVYETDSEGGRAVWDGREINGEKVKTGVYLIFSSTKDGQDTFVGKVIVIE